MNDENIMINRIYNALMNKSPEIINLINEVESEYPSSVALNYYVGKYWKDSGNTEMAKESFYKCININRSFTPAYIDLSDLVPFETIEPLIRIIFNKKTMIPTTGKMGYEFETQLRICSILGIGYSEQDEVTKARNVYNTMIDKLGKRFKENKKFNDVEWQCWKTMHLSIGSLYSNREPEKALNYYKKGLVLTYPFNMKELPITDSLSHSIRDMDKQLIHGIYLMKGYCLNRDITKNDFNINRYFETWRNETLNDKLTIRDSSRKIRIGYLSPDFNRNAVGLFLTPLLKHFDKSKFEVYCYDNNEKSDDYSKIFHSFSDLNWFNISRMNTFGVLNLIKNHEIDILIDLIGHGPKNRMETLSMKPAPIIINYLGFPGETNLKEIDYRIVDKVSDPLNSENLIKLDNNCCFVCYSLFENTELPKIVNRNETSGIREGNGSKIRIGIMNKSAKCSTHILKIWKDILMKNKRIELWVKLDQHKTEKATEAHKRIYSEFPEGRVHFFGFCELLPDYFQLYNQIDFCIDTYPYSGTTTTCSALLMGVPTFTIYNRNNPHVSNVTGSILTHCGLGSFVCDNTKDYKERIVKFGNNEMSKESIRKQFLKTVGNSELFMKEYESKLMGLMNVD